MRTLTMLSAAVMAAGCAVSTNEALAAAPSPLTAVPALPALPAPPAAPAPPPGFDDPAANAKQASMEAQLAAARQRLEVAANEVARLSMQVSGPWMQQFQTHFQGRAHAIIGVELDTGSGLEGARVDHVSPGSPADEAGIRPGDLIVSVNGTEGKGEEAERMVRAIREASPGTKLNIRVLHNGKPKDLVVVARAAEENQFFVRTNPGDLMMSSGAPVFSFNELGIPSLSNLQLATLTPGLGHYFGTEKGVLVVRAPTKSDFKLQDGDVILSIDGREPTSGAHATRILSSYQGGEKIKLHIMRDRKPLDLETQLPEQTTEFRHFQAPRPIEGPQPERQ